MSTNAPDNTKPGTRTTEFWVSIAPVAASLVEGLKGDSQNSSLLMVCATALGIVYIISRTVVKAKASSRSR
jgi:hypothetical protein